MITKEEVLNAQSTWGKCIVSIGANKNNSKDELETATKEVLDLYAFAINQQVLFKPTKAAVSQFRNSVEDAKSYFIGGKHGEDHGFALNPWTNVRFENEDIVLGESHAIAMGNYFFTDPSGTETKVEYTFGYLKDDVGNLKINLHHSSIPFLVA